MSLSDDILFASGSAQLDAAGIAILAKVAARLKTLPHRIEVQGHTDNRGIRGYLAKRYPTNWELAGARAARVTRLLQKEGIDGTRLSSVSFAEFAPVASNDTAEDRAYNRRIEIRLHPTSTADVGVDMGADSEAGGDGAGAAPPSERAPAADSPAP